MRTLARLALSLGLALAASASPGQALVDDRSPWWVWADRWEGDYSYAERMHAPGALNSMTSVRAKLVLDQRSATGCAVTWTGSDRNSATIDSLTEGRFSEQNDVTKLGGQSSDATHGAFHLSQDSALTISLDHRQYKLHLQAAANATASSDSKSRSSVEMKGLPPQSIVLDNSGRVPVEFSRTEYWDIPSERGPLTQAVTRKRDPGAGGSHTERTNLRLHPEHDFGQWKREYKDLLGEQRQAYKDQLQAILEGCRTGAFSGLPCRAAQAGIDRVDERITRLADDCRRILAKLVDRQCRGFARAMHHSPWRDQYETAVCAGPAQTCEALHSIVFSFFDDKATGDVEVTRRRLPDQLQCLYSTGDEFEPMATLGATGVIGKLLGQ